MTRQQQVPRLETLQQFTNSYFRDNAPVVRWGVTDDKDAGEADFKGNGILLNDVIPLNCQRCGIAGGFLFYEPNVQFTLDEGEQYFLVLLHEIGHFKITKRRRVKIPPEYKKLRQLLKREKITDPNERQGFIEQYMEQRVDSEYLSFTIDDFNAYLYTGDFIADHSAVEDWAVAEFQERRAEIRALLGYVPKIA